MINMLKKNNEMLCLLKKNFYHKKKSFILKSFLCRMNACSFLYQLLLLFYL